MKLSRERILLLTLLAAAIAVWWLAWGEINDDFTVTVFDVGQGDWILVQVPRRGTITADRASNSRRFARMRCQKCNAKPWTTLPTPSTAIVALDALVPRTAPAHG